MTLASTKTPTLVKLLLAGLCLAAALPASAQTDLVERTVAATHAAEAAGQYFNPMSNPVEGLPPETIADSVRARLRADLRPDALREALGYLEAPGARRVAERMLRRPDPMRITTVAYGPGLGLPVPKKGGLADSALTARYLAATGREDASITFLRRVLLAAAEAAPAVIAREVRPGETVEQMIDRMLTELRASLGPVLLATTRLQLAGASTADVEEAIAAEQTGAVRYVRATVAEGTARAVAPVVAAMALAEQAGAEAEVVPVPKPR